MLSIFKRTPRSGQPSLSAHPAVAVLGVERHYDLRPGREVAESMHLLYTRDGRPGRTTVWLTWHSLARLREALAKEQREVAEETLLEAVALQWGKERLEEAFGRGEDAPADGYVLSFATVPQPAGPRQLLQRCGLL